VEARKTKARICMLLTNPGVNDSRVLREARALAGVGYDVRLIATSTPDVPTREERDGFRVVRVEVEPRFAGLARRVGSAVRPLLARSKAQAPAAGPVDGAEQGLFGDDAWVAAVGGGSDGELLLRNPRAGALRLGLRAFLVLRWWRFARSAWATIKEEPADVYLAHDLDTLPVGVLAKSRLGGRLIYDSHELYTDQSVTPPPSRMWRARWRLIERALIRRADAVMTVCDGIADELSKRYAIERPAVVRNIPELVDGSGPEPSLRERFGISSDTRIALYLGGIQLNRRLEHYIDAVGPLDDVVLVLMGPGDPAYVAHLRAYAERLGYPERVRISGPVPPDRVTSAARDADLGLVVLQRSSLSDWYCLPSKLFESIQAQIPVVANDWPELRRIVDEYGVGVLNDSDEPAAITASIRDVLGDRDGYERMRDNARRASEELNWQVESKRLLRVLDSVTEAPAGPPAPRSAGGARALR
jgi:glycosyltransferase involved in cell wall biosynthesis